MKRLSLEELAGILAKNPDLRARNANIGFKVTKLPSATFDLSGNPVALPGHEKPAVQTPKPQKYRNQPTEVDGIRFDSKKEASRWAELQVLERAGEIKNLERQVKISIDVNGQHICNYIADARYHEKIPGRVGKWRIVVEDTKSDMTRKLPTYRLKKKLVKALFGIEILET